MVAGYVSADIPHSCGRLLCGHLLESRASRIESCSLLSQRRPGAPDHFHRTRVAVHRAELDTTGNESRTKLHSCLRKYRSVHAEVPLDICALTAVFGN
jgi:hypothetical protein